MEHLKRVLFAIVLGAVASAPALAAPDPLKPKVRAITGFITIDAKTYRMQIQETVTFLSQVRESIKAAGTTSPGSVSRRSRSPSTREDSAVPMP